MKFSVQISVITAVAFCSVAAYTSEIVFPANSLSSVDSSNPYCNCKRCLAFSPSGWGERNVSGMQIMGNLTCATNPRTVYGDMTFCTHLDMAQMRTLGAFRKKEDGEFLKPLSRAMPLCYGAPPLVQFPHEPHLLIYSMSPTYDIKEIRTYTFHSVDECENIKKFLLRQSNDEKLTIRIEYDESTKKIKKVTSDNRSQKGEEVNNTKGDSIQ